MKRLFILMIAFLLVLQVGPVGSLAEDEPMIDITVYDRNADDWLKWTNVNMYDDVNVKITSTVPVMTDYTSYQYIVHVAMRTDFWCEPYNVVVKINDVTLASKENNSEDYDYELIADNPYFSDDFHLVFDPVKFAARTPGDLIEITYTGALLEDAVVGAPGNPNTVYLEYSNDSHGTSTEKTPEDEVLVFTYKLDIYKYTGNLEASEDTPLAGAKFELHIGSAVGPRVSIERSSQGMYNVCGTSSWIMFPDIGPWYDFETSASGRVTVKGLAAGTYYLVETRAPTGFSKLSNAIKIVITPADDTGAYAMTVDDVIATTVNVPNNFERGDANCDGKVDAADAAAILRHLVRLQALSNQGLINAKVTSDLGPVSAADAARILRFLVRLESKLY